MNKGNVIELVIYHVKAESLNELPDQQTKMIEDLRQHAGVRSGKTFRSLKHSNVFADYICWDSLEDATKAAEVMQGHPYMQLIEKVELFDHFELNGEPSIEKESKESEENDVWELAVGRISQAQLENFHNLRPPLFQKVGEMEGFRGISSLQALENPEKIVDLLHWESMNLANKAMEKVHALEECQTFMATFEENLFFDHMELVSAWYQ